MPNVSNFGAQTDNAVVQGTVTDRAMVIPDIPPQGLMSVGPRVTPHFVKPSLWSALTTYHFFDAVHDAAGASYVAIKPEVPAGTELTDEGYWFLWADPNSQFADLSELVKTFDGRISQNTADIATKAPNNHASEEATYGVGNEVNYGHVRLAAEDTPLTSGANEGIAATPKMLKSTLDGRSNLVNVLKHNFTTDIDAPTFNTWLTTLPLNSTIFFPAGAYNINGPIKFPENTRMNIVGEVNACTEQDAALQTSLNFTGLNSGDWALTPSPSRVLIKDIKIKCNSFKIEFDKNDFAPGVDTSNVTLNNKNIGGIYVPDNSYGMLIDNVTVTQCSKIGIRSSIYTLIHNCGVFNCATGITLRNDCNLSNCRIVNVQTGINVSNASLSQISNTRIDSVALNAIYASSSNGLIIQNINADYVQGNAIVLNNCTQCAIETIISRCGVQYAADKSSYANSAVQNSHKEAALIRIQNGVKNCIIKSPYAVLNPIDISSDYLAPLNFVFFDSSNIENNTIKIETVSPFNTFTGNITANLMKEIVGKSVASVPNTTGSIAGIPFSYQSNKLTSPTYAQVS